MHGHSCRVEVVVEGPLDPAKGYLVDFGDLKAATQPIEQALDHRCLNEIAGLENPPRDSLSTSLPGPPKPVLPPLSWIIDSDSRHTLLSTP